MKRKFLSTFLVAIVLLFCLLLSGCGKTFPSWACLSIKEKVFSYSLDEKYLITVKYGHSVHEREEDVDKIVGYITCCGHGEGTTTSTEIEILFKFNSYFSDENYVERKHTRLGNHILWTSYEFNQEVTLEIPKSHIVGEKGYILLGLVGRPAEGEIAPLDDYRNGCLRRIHYEKIDGKIHFTVEALK